jgi:hypothetical protein
VPPGDLSGSVWKMHFEFPAPIIKYANCRLLFRCFELIGRYGYSTVHAFCYRNLCCDGCTTNSHENVVQNSNKVS